MFKRLSFLFLFLFTFECFAGPSCEELMLSAESKNLLKKISEKIYSDLKKFKRLPKFDELMISLNMKNIDFDPFKEKELPKGVKKLLELSRDIYPEFWSSFYSDAVKSSLKYLKENLRLPSNEELANEMGYEFSEVKKLIVGKKNEINLRIFAEDSKDLEVIRNKFIKAYTEFCKAHGWTPTEEHLENEMNLKSGTLKGLIGKGKLFDHFNEILDIAKERDKRGSTFKRVYHSAIFTPEKYEKLKEAIEKADSYIIVGASAGRDVNIDALAALKTISKSKSNSFGNAPIIVIPVDPINMDFDEALLEDKDVHIIPPDIGQIRLSYEWAIDTIEVMGKQKDPNSGLDDYEDRGLSLILGSPQMRVRTLGIHDPVVDYRMLFTTGSITEGIFDGKYLIQHKTDKIAQKKHKIAALLFEKTNGRPGILQEFTHGDFHPRHLEYIPEKKGFLDLNTFYSTDKIEKEVRPLALVPGDLHLVVADQEVLKHFLSIVMELQPRAIYWHDFLNLGEISHHEKNKVVKQAKKARNDELRLIRPLNQATAFFNAFYSNPRNKDIDNVIVVSNHNGWLNSWLEDANWIKEHQNAAVGAKLFEIAESGQNVLEWVLRNGIEGLVQPLDRRYWNKIVIKVPGEEEFIGPVPGGFTEEGIPFRGRQVLTTAHGHVSSEGARGGAVTKWEKIVDRVIYGHTHTYQRKNGIVNVGLLARKDQDYAIEGASNWVHSVGLIGENGEMQVLVFKNGEFYRPDGSEIKESDLFFEPGHPYYEMKPKLRPDQNDTVDQFRKVPDSIRNGE
ncbi:MAG: hypothetical protein H6622_03100 [Halobacteriovoraceae bacterium]|nr:hypothetical protein [Halobacteriovoraceae bacterium]